MNYYGRIEEQVRYLNLKFDVMIYYKNSNFKRLRKLEICLTWGRDAWPKPKGDVTLEPTP